MRLIGLCGRSGSGKSSFCKLALELGFIVIDCDLVYNELVSKRTPCLDELEANFGKTVIENDSLNRKKLAPIVFSDREKLELLNKITHKHITNRIFEMLGEYGEDAFVILDAPTLFESGLDNQCESVIGIIAPDELCISRIIKRDGITEQQAASRLSNQLTNDFIIEHSDYIVYNETTPEAFAEASQGLLVSLKEDK